MYNVQHWIRKSPYCLTYPNENRFPCFLVGRQSKFTSSVTGELGTSTLALLKEVPKKHEDGKGREGWISFCETCS